MPTRKPQTESKASKCMGGKSYGCRTEEHEKSVKFPDITCYRCGTRMGCGWCCQMPRELVCLRCHDWGSAIANDRHGPMVESREKRLAEIKAIARSAVGES